MSEVTDLLEQLVTATNQTNAILSRMATAIQRSDEQTPLETQAKDPVIAVETPTKAPNIAAGPGQAAGPAGPSFGQQAQSTAFQAGQILIGSATESTAETLLSLRKFGNETAARSVGAGIDSLLGTNLAQPALRLAAQYKNQSLTRQQGVISSAINQTIGQITDPSLLGVRLSDDQIKALYQRNKEIETLRDQAGERVRGVASEAENAKVADVIRILNRFTPEQLARDIAKMATNTDKLVNDQRDR